MVGWPNDWRAISDRAGAIRLGERGRPARRIRRPRRILSSRPRVLALKRPKLQNEPNFIQNTLSFKH
jgi:hypothetical protein